MRVLSANCQGLGNYIKRRDVLDYFYNLPANIVFLQDTHWIDKDLKSIKQVWNGDCFVSGKSSNSKTGFFTKLGEILDSDEQVYCIICGDFNIAYILPLIPIATCMSTTLMQGRQ